MTAEMDSSYQKTYKHIKFSANRSWDMRVSCTGGGHFELCAYMPLGGYPILCAVFCGVLKTLYPYVTPCKITKTCHKVPNFSEFPPNYFASQLSQRRSISTTHHHSIFHITTPHSTPPLHIQYYHSAFRITTPHSAPPLRILHHHSAFHATTPHSTILMYLLNCCRTNVCIWYVYIYKILDTK